MHVVLYAADPDRRAFDLFADAAQVGVQRVARDLVAKERTTLFRRENEVDVHGGKGLQHMIPQCTTPLGLTCLMDHFPRVAALRQPWAGSQNAFGVIETNPLLRVMANTSRDGRSSSRELRPGW